MAGDRWDYDALIVGGGPAGSVAATTLAREGRRVLLVERQRFPRFHIGESLLPASNGVFHDLGLEREIRDQGFMEKRGASFATEDGGVSGYVDFEESREVAAPVTYQVPRARFDQLLLDAAARAGAEVRQGTRTRRIEFDDGGAAATLAGADGGEQSARVGVVVDASGQSGVLAKQLGVRRPDPRLRSVAIHAQFEGVPLVEGPRAGDVRIISLRNMGWVWLIPLSRSLMSVGLVLPVEVDRELAVERGGPSLDEYLRSIETLTAPFADASRVSEVRRDADYAYACTRYAGDRWLLAGDAGSFLDPVFSTGVQIALQSGYEAGRAIHRGLRRGRLDYPAFRAYDRRQRRRYRFFRRFTVNFYDPAFRSVFLQPSTRWGLQEAVVTALAGIWPPARLTRWRIGLFFALVAIQRRFAVVPELHGARAGAAAAEAGT